MAKLTAYCITSVDGVFDEPNPIAMGASRFFDEAYLQDSRGLFLNCETMLFGRKSYQIFAEIYGKGGGNPYYADRLNDMKKVVFSSQLSSVNWNNSRQLYT